MNMMVTFRSRERHAIAIGQESVGLDGLDRARKEIGAMFDIGLMQDYIPYINSDPKFTLSEATARDSDLYTNGTHIVVYVPQLSLNGFTITRVVTSREEANDAINNVKIVREIDYTAITDAWKESGYPVEWNPIDE